MDTAIFLLLQLFYYDYILRSDCPLH